MVSYEYDLGEIKHVKLDSNLKLTTRCRIKFSSSCALVFPFSKFFQNLDTLITSDAWITRGNGLQVSFQLLTDEVASYYFDRSTFVDDLRVILLNAEVLFHSSY